MPAASRQPPATLAQIRADQRFARDDVPGLSEAPNEFQAPLETWGRSFNLMIGVLRQRDQARA